MRFIDAKLHRQRDEFTSLARSPSRQKRALLLREQQGSNQPPATSWLLEALQDNKRGDRRHQNRIPRVDDTSSGSGSDDGGAGDRGGRCGCGNLVPVDAIFTRRGQPPVLSHRTRSPPEETVREKLVVALALARVKKRQRTVRQVRELASEVEVEGRAAQEDPRAAQEAQVSSIVSQMRSLSPPRSTHLAVYPESSGQASMAVSGSGTSAPLLLKRGSLKSHLMMDPESARRIQDEMLDTSLLSPPCSPPPGVSVLLEQGGHRCLEAYLDVNPHSARRIQAEMSGRSLLSPASPRGATEAVQAETRAGWRVCPNGCGIEVSLHSSLWLAHGRECPMGIVECEFQGCRWKGTRVDLGEHEWNEADGHLELERVALSERRGEGYRDALNLIDDRPPW